MKETRMSSKITYKKTSHGERIDVIYKRLVLNVPVRHMSRERGLAENTIRNYLHAYKNGGRTNKKVYRRGYLKDQDQIVPQDTKQAPTFQEALSTALEKAAKDQTKRCQLKLLVAPS